jgi:predicted PurR-regulated permease PerM
VYLLVNQVIGLVGKIQSGQLFQQGGFNQLLQDLRNSTVNQWLERFNISWQDVLRTATTRLGSILTEVVNRTTTDIAAFVFNLLVLMFTLFFFFRDGPKIVRKILSLIPMRRRYKEMLMSRFATMAKATLVGSLSIGLIHGTIGAITLLAFGIPAWLLWAVIIVFLAFIPIFGPWLILVPVGIVKIALGQLGAGVVIILIGTVVMMVLDNILRPHLVGHSSRMHDLMIFFSTLGGIIVYGVVGFIVGPVIAALFITSLSIYRIEFQSSLASEEEQGTMPPAKGPRRARR